jgi:hypothetical protein
MRLIELLRRHPLTFLKCLIVLMILVITLGGNTTSLEALLLGMILFGGHDPFLIRR